MMIVTKLSVCIDTAVDISCEVHVILFRGGRLTSLTIHFRTRRVYLFSKWNIHYNVYNTAKNVYIRAALPVKFMPQWLQSMDLQLPLTMGALQSTLPHSGPSSRGFFFFIPRASTVITRWNRTGGEPFLNANVAVGLSD